jgi:hypothetical protein
MRDVNVGERGRERHGMRVKDLERKKRVEREEKRKNGEENIRTDSRYEEKKKG